MFVRNGSCKHFEDPMFVYYVTSKRNMLTAASYN